MAGKSSALFTPYKLGDVTFRNRMVMAPMTRSRAAPGALPNPLAATYYAQRAAAGLIVAEATQVTRKVSAIFARREYTRPNRLLRGAWSPTEYTQPAASSLRSCGMSGAYRIPRSTAARCPWPPALGTDAEVFTESGPARTPVPRALGIDEIAEVVEQFRLAARNADLAGFDGVEIHGSSGYLLDQFLRDGSNRRNDDYGGTIANRARFPLEVAAAVVDTIGGDRVGCRVGPSMTLHGMNAIAPTATYTNLAEALDRLGIAYLHVTEGVAGPDAPAEGVERVAPYLRRAFTRSVILNGGFDAETGAAAIAWGDADLISYGVPFLANPDLPARFRNAAPLNEPDYATFYAPAEDDAVGYTDYPFLPLQ